MNPECVSNAINEEIEKIRVMLQEKNRRYGNAALDPVQIFSRLSTREALLVRIDDKLNRVKKATDGDIEDPVLDLIGYLILLKVDEHLEGHRTPFDA